MPSRSIYSSEPSRRPSRPVSGVQDKDHKREEGETCSSKVGGKPVKEVVGICSSNGVEETGKAGEETCNSSEDEEMV